MLLLIWTLRLKLSISTYIMSNTVNSNKKFHTLRPIKIKKKKINIYNVK